MTAWDAVRLVAGREIRTRLRTRAFRIFTLVMIIAVVGFIIAIKLMGNISQQNVAFTPSAAPLVPAFTSVADSIGQSVKTSTVDQATGEQMVRDGKLDALVTGTPTDFGVVVRRDLPGGLSDTFNVLTRQVALNQQLVQAGADPAAVAKAVQSATFDVQRLEPERPYQTERLLLGVIVGILVYIALLVYGQVVAQGVVEEKSSRVVEILLTTIRPWQLMLGKVAGIGIVGLLQLGTVAVIGVVAGVATDVVNFPASIAASAAIWAVVWFLIGYLAYALMFAALGALVSRQEDVGAVTTPAMMVIILPYVLGISILPADPENQFLGILALIPLFSPTLMPMKIAMGTASTAEIVLSLGLTVGLVVALIWLSGRIYSNAVLRMGSRVRLRDALRSAV